MTKHQKYNLLLSNAHCASKEVDYYDLRSEIPASVIVWNRLLKAQAKANKKLVKFIIKHPKCYKIKETNETLGNK